MRGRWPGVSGVRGEGLRRLQCRAGGEGKRIDIGPDPATTGGAETVKGVTVGGALYVQARGVWKKRPMTAQAAIASRART